MSEQSLTAADLRMLRSLVSEAQRRAGLKLAAAKTADEQEFYRATMTHLAALDDRLKARNAGALLERALAAEAATDETGEQEDEE